MFKDFTGFNSLATKLFKDEPFRLVMSAFSSFQSLLAALRTEAYDYATWYNKVMRDKYEDGEPVDITNLPYLSVPRSQLAVMRARIAKVREAVTYAANAITNVAIGFKNALPVRISATGDDISPTFTSTTIDEVKMALKRIVYSIGGLVITFDDGDQQVIVNGVSVGVSPLVRGSLTIAKRSTGNSAQAAIISRPGVYSMAESLINNYLNSPLIVARSQADLGATSAAPIGMLILNRNFFGKRLIVWLQSTSTQIDQIKYGDGIYATVFAADVKVALVENNAIKSTIAESLYGTSTQDYTDAMNYTAPTSIKIGMYIAGSGGLYEALAVGVNLPAIATSSIYLERTNGDAVTQQHQVESISTDVTTATTQTAISDMFFTPSEWTQLENSLSEA